MGTGPAQPVLSSVSEAPSPFLAYVLDLLGQRHGIPIRLCTDPGTASAEVYHGNGPAGPAKLRIPLVAAYTEADVPGLEALAGPVPGTPFPFDVFAAIRFWLADEGNAGAPDAAFDAHDRLVGEHSVQARRGLLRVPIVNAYLALLADWLAACCGVQRRSTLPPGKRATVVLTHDCDGPIPPTDPRHALWRTWHAASGGYPLAAARHGVSTAVRSLRWLGRLERARWAFDDLMASEERLGVRSTMLFSVRSRAGRYSAPFDENYDVRDPRFRRLFARLLDGGWEVGLHTGYRAHEAVGHIRWEKRELERAAGVRVLGNRHHYWHMARPFWPTLEHHAAAGFSYDCSVAFNEVPGYRLGVAFPCQLWNPELGRPVPAIQIPTMVMDGAYYYHPGQKLQATMDDFAGLLEQLKRFEGVAAINWHTRMAIDSPGPFREWGRAYQAILELIAGDPGVHVTSAAGLLGLTQQRLT